MSELERFILEMGSDFAFMTRQKHFVLDGKDYYMDLLFYHRSLRRLVLIELKLGAFEPEHKGQVELYLRWLKKNEMCEGRRGRGFESRRLDSVLEAPKIRLNSGFSVLFLFCIR